VALTFTIDGPTNTIRFDGTPDPDGVCWYATVTGWDGPPLTTQLTARPGDHGAFRGPSNFNSRPLTVAGHARCPDTAAVREARDKLDLLVPIGEDVWVTSAEQKSVIAQLAGALLKASVNEQTLTFSIPLEAALPYKFGPEQEIDVPMLDSLSVGAGQNWLFPLALYQESGQLLANPGTMPARPTITYYGPCNQPYSTNADTGVTDSYDLFIATGDFLVVDHDLGSALLNGVSPRRNTRIPGSRPWMLEPQSAQTIVAGASFVGGGAHVGISYYPTYL
jgi:hypothetical protein